VTRPETRFVVQFTLAIVGFAVGGWALSFLAADVELLIQHSWAPLAGGYWLAYLGLSIYLWRLARERPGIRFLIALPIVTPPVVFAGYVFGWPVAVLPLGGVVVLVGVVRWIHIRRLTPARTDLRAARRVSGVTGHVRRHDAVVCWTDADGATAERILSGLRRLAESLGELTGISTAMQRPLRILAFSNDEAARRFDSRHWPEDVPLAGLYFPDPRPRILISLEAAGRIPSTLDRAVSRISMNWLLSRRRAGSWPPLWLVWGLADAVADRIESPTRAPGGHTRALAIAKAREELLDAGRLDDVDELTIASWTRDISTPRGFGLYWRMHEQARSLVDYLIAEQGDGFRALCNAVRSERDPPSSLQEYFGVRTEALLAGWRAGVHEAEQPGYPSAPPPIRQALEVDLLSVVGKPNTPSPARRRAIRAWGTAGWPWGCDTVIRVLREGEGEIMMDAHIALEHVSGVMDIPPPPHHDCVDGWQRWAQQAGVVLLEPCRPA